MDDVFNEQPEQEVQTPAEEGQQVEQTTEQSEVTAETTAATNTEKHVPLAALEAERRGRQDWKERATRAEERARMLEEQQQARATQGEPQQVDPLQAMEARFVNLTLNASERMARKTYGDEAVNQAFERFRAATEKNPLLHQQAMSSADPWDFVVQEAQRMSVLEEVGSDPKAYRERLKAELMAELQKTTPAALNLPSSLAGARSTATRSAPAFTGPAPLGTLFNN
jgi:hypothetical protein